MYREKLRGKKPYQERFTKNGRTAFKLLMRALGLKKEHIILIPAYIGLSETEGSGVLDPIEAFGMQYEFYAVDNSLSPILDDLEKKIAASQVAAVLVIHYFGFPAPNFEEVVKLCRTNNTVLIEDCAHALHSSYQGKWLGEFGDAAFFSIHKFLPTRAGGIARLNTGEAHFPEKVKDSIEPQVLAAYRQADLEAIGAVRRDNYQYLQSKLTAAKPFFESLPRGVTPMNFPVWIEDMNRDDYYFKLQERGIRTSTLYYRLVPQIIESSYPASYEISRHISNLPIHQGMTHHDIDRVVDGVHAVLAGK